ncbi:MAG: EAL domain-containing protein, partial [Burkholderiales bacterium]|nr:EAL domain-containing protein [Burkholderiales bacterium]
SLLRRAGWQPGQRLDGAALGLALVYQPYARLSDGAVQGAEVLLRWNHPRLGPLLPLEFIALLESDGGIVPVGDWVLRTACARLGQWRDEGLDLRLAVNLAPSQLRPGLTEDLQRLLSAHGLPISALELELTEGAALVDEGDAQRELQRLSEAGIGLAIDDFGTAFANYDRLSRVRFDKLKLDRSLCRRAIADERAQRLLHGLVNTAHELQMSVTAEGVESDSDWRLLAALGCDLAQGYRLSAPLDEPAFTDWWRARCAA